MRNLVKATGIGAGLVVSLPIILAMFAVVQVLELFRYEWRGALVAAMLTALTAWLLFG